MEFLSPFHDNIRNVLLILFSQIAAFVLALLLAPHFIKLLHRYKVGKQLRDRASTGEKAVVFQELHAKKQGTPTMGGILIWGTVIIIVLLSFIPQWLGITGNSLFSRQETLLPFFTLIAGAILGAFDDYLNLKGAGKTKGFDIKPKFTLLTILALAGALWFNLRLGYTTIHVPFIGDLSLGNLTIDLNQINFFNWEFLQTAITFSPLYIVLFIFIITATSNAVNITDGLDGLAGGLLIISFLSFAVIAYIKGLLILSAFCTVISGAIMGFLWFNIVPAKFYMGDTGAISLGATLGVIAMMTDSVFVLPLIGFIYVIETGSVILQIGSKKILGRKLFLIAPLHHHFEKLGWHESTVVMRFWLIGGFMAALGIIVGLM